MLNVSHLSKKYAEKDVLKDISFSVPSGIICGLIGKNGSGKTTLFHSILKFVRYEGEIELNSKAIDESTYSNIGYLPEERSLVPKMTILDQVSYLANLKGVSKQEVVKLLPIWMDRLQVKGKVTDRIKSLSKGNQQKIQLIITLIHEPDFIILDEPFSGLDPVNAGLLKKVILEEKQRGATIIFSDHVMTNVEELCDNLLMINNGRLVLNGPISKIRESFGKTRLFVTQDIPKERLENLPYIRSISSTNNGTWRIILDDEKSGREIFQLLSGGEYLSTFDQQSPTIDEIFKMETEINNE